VRDAADYLNDVIANAESDVVGGTATFDAQIVEYNTPITLTRRDFGRDRLSMSEMLQQEEIVAPYVETHDDLQEVRRLSCLSI